MLTRSTAFSNVVSGEKISKYTFADVVTHIQGRMKCASLNSLDKLRRRRRRLHS